jgi:polynucleotide 5'-kinase involved in rRNA processing
VRRPRDKAKVEQSVLLGERWILARLGHQTCFSLSELNAAIRALLGQLNERPFKKLPGCRRALFEQLDRPTMTPLPPERCSYAVNCLIAGPTGIGKSWLARALAHKACRDGFSAL